MKVRNAMRELDSSSSVSPEHWEGGRPQRARHMSAMESGTEMSPCPRGCRLPARDALDAVMMLSSRPVMEVRGSGSAAARRMQPRALVANGGRRALGWGRNNCTAARHRALSPNNPPARPWPNAHGPSLFLPNRSCAVWPPIAYREGKGAGRRPMTPPSFPISPSHRSSPSSLEDATPSPSQPHLVMPPSAPFVGRVHVARRAPCLFRCSLTGAAE